MTNNTVQPIKDKQKIETLKKVLKANNARDHCLFVLGINSGLRISDLLSLTVADVLDEDGKICDRMSVKEKKTGKRKEFPISSAVKKAINDYLRTRDWERIEPLFLSRKRKNGGFLTRERAYWILRNAAREIGLKRVGTHTMRKTFGYFAYKKGVGIEVIQKLLNHSSPRVTLAYIGITQEELDNVHLTLDI